MTSCFQTPSQSMHNFWWSSPTKLTKHGKFPPPALLDLITWMLSMLFPTLTNSSGNFENIYTILFINFISIFLALRQINTFINHLSPFLVQFSKRTLLLMMWKLNRFLFLCLVNSANLGYANFHIFIVIIVLMFWCRLIFIVWTKTNN